MAEHLKNIAICNIARDSLFIPELVKLLKKRHGSSAHIYVNQHSQAKYYRRFAEAAVFDTVNLVEHAMPMDFGKNLEAPEVFSKARAYETRYGLTFNKLAVGHRHFGRGYALSAPYFPRSHQSENVSYVEMIDAFNNIFKNWENEFKNKGITLMLNGQSAQDCWAARGNGIPMRAIFNVRVGNRRMWANDESGSSHLIESAFDKIMDELPAIESIPPIPYQLLDETVNIPKTYGLSGLIRSSVNKLIEHTKFKLTSDDKAKMYYPSSEIKFFYRRWREQNYIKKSHHFVRLNKLVGRPFVFFPLAVEPELALMVASPEYFYQHAAIAALSRDLPAGVFLAVKEHAHCIGRRPPGFYRQLNDLKNVILLDMSAPGVEVVKHATAVATIRGTSGYEAAMMGKPVISFGRHNTHHFLPHVHPVTDEAVLPSLLQKIVEGDFDADKARQDGAKFRQALIDVSFEHNTGWHSLEDYQNFDDETVEVVYQALIESLE